MRKKKRKALLIHKIKASAREMSKRDKSPKRDKKSNSKPFDRHIHLDYRVRVYQNGFCHSDKFEFWIKPGQMTEKEAEELRTWANFKKGLFTHIYENRTSRRLWKRLMTDEGLEHIRDRSVVEFEGRILFIRIDSDASFKESKRLEKIA